VALLGTLLNLTIIYLLPEPNHVLEVRRDKARKKQDNTYD
jgi:hypothetical protein